MTPRIRREATMPFPFAARRAARVALATARAIFALAFLVPGAAAQPARSASALAPAGTRRSWRPSAAADPGRTAAWSPVSGSVVQE
jgi:hypothetical protein